MVGLMSEKRFKLQHINDLTDQEYMRLKKITDNGELITLGEVVDLLNEQQATINRMKHSLNTIYKSFEKKFGYDMRNAIWLIDEISYEEWEDKLHIAETDAMNHKESSMYWKNKCDEQQATINKLQEEKGYWESKAMTLLLQVRRLTSRMTDKEVKEFSKELEDE